MPKKSLRTPGKGGGTSRRETENQSYAVWLSLPGLHDWLARACHFSCRPHPVLSLPRVPSESQEDLPSNSTPS